MKNKKKKLNLPQYGFGGTPQLFDVASDMLIGQSMNAVTNMVKAIQQPETERRLTTKNSGMIMANGGQVPVEVEGGEMFELPNGEVGEFEGAKHENGGIPIALPSSTKVYSDRLKIDGKTMAERKDKREKNVSKLEKLLSKSPSDKILKASLERTKEVNAQEEQEDMLLQQGANMMGDFLPEMKMAFGGPVPKQSSSVLTSGEMSQKTLEKIMKAYPTPEQATRQQQQYLNERANKEFMWYHLNQEPITNEEALEKAIRSYATDEQNAYSSLIKNTYGEGGDEDLSLSLLEKNLGHGLTKLANGTPPDGVGKMYYNLPGLLPKTYYQNNNNKWSYWNEGMKTWKDLDAANNKYLSKFKLDDKYLYNPPSTPITSADLLGNTAENFLAPQSNVYNINSTNETPVTVPNPNDFGDTRNNPGWPLNTGIDNNPVTAMLQQTLLSDPYAGTYPLDPQITPTKDVPKSNKFKNFLSNLFGGNSSVNNADELQFTRGDLMGLAGNIEGKFGPLAATLLNRMETPKNINFFREYGAEGMRAMQEAQALANINKDTQLQDLQLQENTTRSRNRNTARGINTLRSLDLASDMMATEAQGNAYNQYAQQMMQMLNQKAQLENQQDSMVMQGEQQRDLADRQDIDNFYTNLAQNIANMSEFTQKTGRDLNQAQYNKDVLNQMQHLSRYGIGFEMKNGKLQMTYKGTPVLNEQEKKEKKAQAKLKKEEINADNKDTNYNR